MLTLDVEHDSSTDTLRILEPDALGDADVPSLQSARIERQLTRQPDAADTAEVAVYRDAWRAVTPDLDRTDDRLVIRESGTPIFGGRLADVERNGIVVSVLIDGPKRDAIDAEPSGGNEAYAPQADSALVTDELLARVPTVDAGTIETVDGGIAFSESHASPAKSIAKLARDADAEVRYRTTDTAFLLDYVARLGSDRTAETLSPSSATVLGAPRVREQVTEDVTHVRVLGAGEGTAQVEAEAIAGSFGSGDRAVYRQRTDKDIQEATRAQALAETLVAEYDGAPEYVEVEFEVPRSVDPALGDEFTVSLPPYGIDTTLRVTTAERLIDGGGDRYRVVLSNRRHTTDLNASERAVELQSLSEGNPGQYYALTDGEGFDPVDSGEPYQFSFFRPPNTIGELRATLQLESRPYRLRASPTQHSHSVDIGTTSASNADFGVPTDQIAVEFFTEPESGIPSQSWTPVHVSGSASPTDTDPLSFDIGVETAELRLDARLDLQYSGSDFAFVNWRLHNVDSGYTQRLNDFDGIPQTVAPVEWQFTDASNTNGDTIQLEFFVSDRGDKPDGLSGWVNATAIGPHSHDITATETTSSVAGVDPGIVEQSNETVSNVDVTVAGQAVATGLDHPIDETVDLSGVLADGRNDIEITSDTLGELRARVEYEAIKNADSR